MSDSTQPDIKKPASRLKWDIILVLIFVSLAAAVLAFMLLSRTEGGTVVITVSGEEYAKVPLGIDSETPVETEFGYNLVIVKNGEAYVAEATCPDKICVHHRKIKFSGESVVCLPNRVAVKITEKGGEELDAVS